MGLKGKDLEKLRAAALLHDYGKIAVRDKFLQKPGKLDDAEFEYMKAHAEKTGEFLEHLVFPRDMRDVPVIAAQHHERMDGKGYPKGLAAIRSVGARIVVGGRCLDRSLRRVYHRPTGPGPEIWTVCPRSSRSEGDGGRHAGSRISSRAEALKPPAKPGDDLVWADPGGGGLSARDRATERGLLREIRFWGTRGSIPTPYPNTCVTRQYRVRRVRLERRSSSSTP